MTFNSKLNTETEMISPIPKFITPAYLQQLLQFHTSGN